MRHVSSNFAPTFKASYVYYKTCAKHYQTTAVKLCTNFSKRRRNMLRLQGASSSVAPFKKLIVPLPFKKKLVCCPIPKNWSVALSYTAPENCAYSKNNSIRNCDAVRRTVTNQDITKCIASWYLRTVSFTRYTVILTSISEFSEKFSISPVTRKFLCRLPCLAQHEHHTLRQGKVNPLKTLPNKNCFYPNSRKQGLSYYPRSQKIIIWQA